MREGRREKRMKIEGEGNEGEEGIADKMRERERERERERFTVPPVIYMQYFVLSVVTLINQSLIKIIYIIHLSIKQNTCSGLKSDPQTSHQVR